MEEEREEEREIDKEEEREGGSYMRGRRRG